MLAHDDARCTALLSFTCTTNNGMESFFGGTVNPGTQNVPPLPLDLPKNILGQVTLFHFPGSTMTVSRARLSSKSLLLSSTRALCVATCVAMVAAFVPSPHVVRPAAAAAAAGRFSCAAASPLSPDGKNKPENLSRRLATAAGDATATCTTSSGSGVARATAPVVLVGSDRALLEMFAENLAAADSPGSSSVVDLREVARSDGARGVELALTRSKAEGVLVCPVAQCLDQPGVESLVHAHPLAVHLATGVEDTAARERCERATKYTVVVGDEKEEEGQAKADLSRLVAFARKPKPSPSDVALDMGKNTFFLSLTFEDFAPHRDLLPSLTEGVDAMELRVDLLADTEDPYSVLRQLSILRRHTGYLPVVFTIRSKGQCGAFPDDPERLFRLARWGLRAGCEVMDVEANWPMSYREGLIREARESYPGAALVGSYHVVGKKTTEEQARELFMECYHDGAVDAVKVGVGCVVWLGLCLVLWVRGQPLGGLLRLYSCGVEAYVLGIIIEVCFCG